MEKLFLLFQYHVTHQSEGGDNTKKYAIVCAMVMLVSIVPAFAAGVDDQGNYQKTQKKYQLGQQNSNPQDTGDHNMIQNKTKTKQQLKTCADCDKRGEKLVKQLKTKNRLKTQNCTI